MVRLTTPISDQDIEALKVGDQVLISGVIVTARDRAHKFLVDNFIETEPVEDERGLYEELKKLLTGGVIYHCGPVVVKDDGGYKFVSAGPTTSTRTEIYEDKVIANFGVKGVIGKGGMGKRTLAALNQHKAVYLHAIGGAGALIAQCVKEVQTVYKLSEFGVPEAFWVIRVEDFPAVVTMDSHERSLHEEKAQESEQVLQTLLSA
jgi:fumarate hydratase class I